MTRVFITTSHLSSVFLTLHARATWTAGMRDVLLVDIGTRRRDVIRVIEEASTLHSWSMYRSFSDEVSDDHPFEPGLRKRLTLLWKELPLLRSIYGALLRRYLRRRNTRLQQTLTDLLAPHATPGEALAIHAHTESHLRTPLMKAFPRSSLEFFEHGQGDYIHILDGERPLGPLRVLFASRFRAYLGALGIDASWVRQLDIGPDFPRLAAALLSRHAMGPPPAAGTKPVVYVLLEALDMYHVPEEFWGSYIDHIISTLDDPQRFHFVLKPHPRQSIRSLEHTLAHSRARGLDHEMLSAGIGSSVATEIEFARWADRTEHVFCLVSSGCFYLSRLYPLERITYHYSTAFMERWIGAAPPQYKRLFEKMKVLITEVLAERCLPY